MEVDAMADDEYQKMNWRRNRRVYEKQKSKDSEVVLAN
jgi:hypothetical protein